MDRVQNDVKPTTDKVMEPSKKQRLPWRPSEIMILLLSVVMLLAAIGLFLYGIIENTAPPAELAKFCGIISIYPVGGLFSVWLLRWGRRQSIQRWHPRASDYL